MSLLVATWNVNSLRVRLPHLLDWLATAKPDIVALQETKVLDKDFPQAELAAAGYQVIFSGQKTYNGVAILSRTAITDIVRDIPSLVDEQRRILLGTVQGVRVVNLYVPNGAAVDSDKYPYKLHWLAQVTAYIKQELIKYPKLVVLGDFNIAPEDRDVHDPNAWEGCVLVSELEREALRTMLTLGLRDAFRLFEQAAGHYSWWDYRAGAFRRDNGLRIDHLLLSAELAKYCTACHIDKIPRSWERPSDHTPVSANFEF